ncbi:hypothetical protein PG985_000927 [Apiospora marii]|uniref:Thioredoxin domain-containing protein n=1 Tax=Apiospora marii TaxID=335849 RepID=A0ABR1RGH4_9PEZI
MLKLGLAAWLAATGVCAWEHVAPSDLETSIKSHGAVVVACESIVLCTQHCRVPSQALILLHGRIALTNGTRDKSKALELEWAPAVAELTAISTLSVDCSQAAAVCQKYDVSSYPSLKVFQGGEPKSTYLGPRRASAITSWIHRAQRPSVSEVPSEELEAFKSGDETVFIAYVAADDQESRKLYEDVASQFRDEFTFGINADDAARQAEGVGSPGLKCHRHLDGDVVTFKGSFDVDAMKAFVDEASRSIISELTAQNQQRLVARGWPMVYLFAATEAERAEFRRTLQKIGRSYYESLTMTTVDPLEFPELPARLGLATPGNDAQVEYPCGAVHQLSKDRIYQYPRGSPVTSSALQQWGLDVWQGRIKPWNPDGAAATTTEEAGQIPGRIRATPRVSIANFPGLNIRIGRDEL